MPRSWQVPGTPLGGNSLGLNLNIINYGVQQMVEGWWTLLVLCVNISCDHRPDPIPGGANSTKWWDVPPSWVQQPGPLRGRSWTGQRKWGRPLRKLCGGLPTCSKCAGSSPRSSFFTLMGNAWGIAKWEPCPLQNGHSLSSSALSKMLFTTWGHTWLSFGALWSFQEEDLITDQKEPFQEIG